MLFAQNRVITRLIKVITRSIPVVVAATMGSAVADFDQWQINELFSNAEGTVQYIELQTDASSQGSLSGLTLVASDASGQQQNTLEISSNLTGDTLGKNLLFATETFVQSTGLSADFEIEDGFLFTEGGSLNFANGTSVISYEASQLAKNGVQSLSGALLPQSSDPTNFSGLTATPGPPLRGIFDTANSIMQLPVLNVPGSGLFNVSFDVNSSSLQFVLRDGSYAYSQGITAGATPAEFQPGNILYIPALPFGTEIYEFNLTLVSDDPVTFANPTVLSITDIPPDPEPDPGPTELEQSISAGGIQFAAQCASCHGSSGGGGIGPNLQSSSFNTFDALRSKVDLTMPDTNPSGCRDTSSSSCATDAANYILNVIQQ